MWLQKLLLYAGDAGPAADLYLEKTLSPSNDGMGFQDASNQGVWIASDQIATIEFMEGQNGN
jgi:hypothetical protein